MQTISRSSLVDDAVGRIRELIEHGKLDAGDRLPSEQVLAGRLGVSRTVLREAASRLETIGVLTVRRGRGMFVGNRSSLKSCAQLVRSAMGVSPKDAGQFGEFRAALECHAARQAALRATPAEAAELAELCDRIDDPLLDDREAMQRDFRFHLRLIEISGNELITNVMQVLQEFALAGMMQTTPSPRDREQSHARHAAIVAGIRDRNPDAAEEAMRSHHQTTLRLLAEVEARSASVSAGA